MDQEAGARVFVNRVYNWMFCGLMITTVIAWGITQLGEAAFKKTMALALPLMIVELVLVIVLSAAIRKMSAPVAGAIFIAYSALNGLTLSPIFLVYTQTSIFLAFGSCALMFAATSTFGYVTGMKLDTVGSYCFMGLIGILIASIVNFFLHSAMLDYILSYVGVAVFVGLTAWDTQKMRMVGEANGEEAQSDAMRKVAIIFALSLYLDFINLFLMLLRIFGRRR
ncbi:MAG: Bax inhibitor-1/YccA family protein [Lentisphaeria bacterium]|nr:Bax inhibitor-1/YccA family protein [Lentisphaeria bacterium]